MHSFSDDGFVSIFDHMFSSCVIEQDYDFGPVRSAFLDKVKQYFILFTAPLSLLDLVIQVVLISFPALFGSFKGLSPRLKVEVLCYLVPLPFLEFTR